MDLEKYRSLFVSEARKHLEEMEATAVNMKADEVVSDAASELFRHAHSIKGMAATMGYVPIKELAHRLEDLIVPLREANPVTERVREAIVRAIASLNDMVSEVEAGNIPQELPADLVAFIEQAQKQGEDKKKL